MDLVALPRFWAKVDQDGPIPKHDPSLGSCWVWTGSRLRNGYGQFHGDPATSLAHRCSYMHHHGPIPDGLYVLHRCDNKACVRPDHLYAGTAKQNAADAVERERNARGERVNTNRLSEWDVRDIREMWANDTCTMSQREIGEAYGVGQDAISKIVLRVNWKHLEQVPA